MWSQNVWGFFPPTATMKKNAACSAGTRKNNLKTTYFTVYFISHVENLKNDRFIHSTQFNFTGSSGAKKHFKESTVLPSRHLFKWSSPIITLISPSSCRVISWCHWPITRETTLSPLPHFVSSYNHPSTINHLPFCFCPDWHRCNSFTSNLSWHARRNGSQIYIFHMSIWQGAHWKHFIKGRTF